MKAIDKMAQAIRRDPSVTVRDLAREMGFAETRSVYYWLSKGRFGGLKEFKRAVLAGRVALPVEAKDIEESIEKDATPEVTRRSYRIPIVGQILANGDRVWSNEYLTLDLPPNLSTHSFAVSVKNSDSEASSWVVVDPNAEVKNRSYVLTLSSEGRPVIARLMRYGANTLCLTVDDEAEVESAVLGVVRARLDHFR